MADSSVHLLCSACKGMFSGRGTRIGWGDCYEHHLPPYKLEAAAKQNCYVCTRLWKALSPNEQKLVRNTLGIIGNGYRWRWFTLLLDRLWCCDWMEGCYGWNCDFGQNRLYFMFGAPGPHRKRVAFDLLHADDPYVRSLLFRQTSLLDPLGSNRLCVKELVSNSYMAASTNSESTWQMIHAWYRESLESEDLDRNAVLPRRLLDLNNSDLSQVRLSLNREERENVPFWTLSYKWGPNPESMKQLTRLGMDAMARSINISALPRIFQEAIEVTRKLGIRYLWIDALCIMQDDPQDLADECALMDEIYRGAICNIAAGTGDRSNGLFVERRPDHVRPLLVDLKWQGFGYRVRRSADYNYIHGLYFVLPADYRRSSVLTAPLNGRAWVLQERLLSSRTLHFGRGQVCWESNRLAACECFPQGYPEPPHIQELLDEVAPIRAMDRRSTLQIYDKDEPHYFVRRWNEIIRLYSKCAITKESDKLVAISGLARHTHKMLKGYSYHAGLWSCEMLQCLLWRVKDGKAADGTPSRRLHHASVPSWSWLSVNGVVEPRDPLDPSRNRKPLADIISCVTIPASVHHPYGTIQNAHIVIAGCLLEGRSVSLFLANLGVSPTVRIYYHNAVSCTIDDVPAFSSKCKIMIIGLIDWIALLFVPLSAVYLSVWTATPLIGRILSFVVCSIVVRICYIFVSGYWINYGSADFFLLPLEEQDPHVHGLVLERRAPGVYSRLGVFDGDGADPKMFSGLRRETITLI